MNKNIPYWVTPIKNTIFLLQCCTTCNYKVPTVLGFFSFLLLGSMLHILYFVFQIPLSDLEFQVMNPECAAWRINVVHFIFLLSLNEHQLKEQANLYENRSLSTVKLTKAIHQKMIFPLALVFVHGPWDKFSIGAQVNFFFFSRAHVGTLNWHQNLKMTVLFCLSWRRK